MNAAARSAAARSAAVQGAAAWRQSEPAPCRPNPTEPDWPEADVIIGNPPFLGDKLLRTYLGDEYIDDLFSLYDDRLPHGSDLCCYWFEKARDMIKRGKMKRAGLLATQGIRGGANREVLKRIKKTGDIFFAVSDRDWILDGANVHVSMIGFDNGGETQRILDGQIVTEVNADLSAGADLTAARVSKANEAIGFLGNCKGGAFDISEAKARELAEAGGNPHGQPNTDVLKPYVNGQDLMGRPRGKWLIDFGINATLAAASLYEAPMQYIRGKVYPVRAKNRNKWLREHWWLHQRARPAMRSKIAPLVRYIVTPTLSKFRVFVWVKHPTLPDHQLIVFAREDDYFFGVLHSAVHERWALRLGTALEDRPRYTPTSCFETFPFPPLAGGIERDVNVAARTPAPEPPASSGPPASSASSASSGSAASSEPPDSSGAHDPTRVMELRARISAAAARLNTLRETWLNPTNPDGSPALSEAALKKRTLTNLYNDRPTWLELAHAELDRAVLAAYGWPEDWAEGLQPRRDEKGRVNPILGVADPAVEEELLARLLALNRATAEG